MSQRDQVQIHVPKMCDAIRIEQECFEFLERNNIIHVETHEDTDDIELLLPAVNNLDPRLNAPDSQLQNAIDEAQKTLVENISKSANTTLKRIGQSFSSYLAMNAALFLIGIGGFVAAIIKGFTASGTQDAVITVVFGGLSAAAFVTLFITKPLEETASAGPEAAWLLSAINTYWTKLVYLDDPRTFIKDIEKAQHDFERSMTLFTQTANYMGRWRGATDGSDVDEVANKVAEGVVIKGRDEDPVSISSPHLRGTQSTSNT